MRTELTGTARSNRRCAWVLGALAGLVACSTQPPQLAPAAAPATPAVPAAAASKAALEPSAAPAAAAKTAAATTADAPRQIPSGYKRVKRNGREVYCRTMTTIGTRIAQEMCFTREQLEEIVDRTDSTMEDLDQALRVCTGGNFCQSD